MTVPYARLQRLRHTQSIRELVSETKLHPSDFVMPVFVKETGTEPVEVSSMPGIYQHTLASVLQHVEELVSHQINAILLFGIPAEKDPHAHEAYNENGIVQQAIRLIRNTFPDLIIMADCCLCEYTSHGHCGIMVNNTLDNDATLTVLQKIAVSYAKAGADVIAPSGMMDGMIQALRHALEETNFKQVSLMSYSAKYPSSFYGPFRDAAGSDGFQGNRKHHQMNPGQRREAFQEALQDVQESADIIMVKPALPYLDIIRDLRSTVHTPIAAYQVSGEYSMIKYSAKAGLLNEDDAILETLTCIKRAGADIIISYFAQDIWRLV